jgi:hypothetical protein
LPRRRCARRVAGWIAESTLVASLSAALDTVFVFSIDESDAATEARGRRQAPTGRFCD